MGTTREQYLLLPILSLKSAPNIWIYRYHYIREVVEQGITHLYFVKTEENPADMLTKNLARDKFLWCRNALGLVFRG
jgi:hypothetical protein